jgi:hypothetical protein
MAKMNNQRIKIAPVKAINEEAGTIDFTLTSKTVDRDGEVVLPSGVKLDNFRKNPVFLWAHSRKDPSIGRVIPETIRVTEDDITATVEFDLDDPFAKMIFGKYKKKHLNAGSISFIPKDFDKPIFENQPGPTFTEAELLEFSGVPIPSNPQALAKEFAEQEGGWMEMVKSFYEEKPEGSQEDWCKFIENRQCEKEQTEEKESILPLLIDDLPESFEWVMQHLSLGASEWLKQYPEIIEEQVSDFTPLVATFDDRAIICNLLLDRPLSESSCYEGRWSLIEGKPAWQGEPRPVEIAVEVIRKLYDLLAVEKDFEQDPGKGTVSYSDTPTVNIDAAWDGNAARNRAVKWASSDSSGDKDKINWSEYRRLFAWYDENKPEDFSSYKLPHHDIIDGEIKSVWRGVRAAMAALLGARGGVNIPDENRRAVYNHLSKHYRQFEQSPPEYRDFKEIAEELIELLKNESIPFDEKTTKYYQLVNYYERLGLKAPELPDCEELTIDELLDEYETEIIREVLKLLQGGNNNVRGKETARISD